MSDIKEGLARARALKKPILLEFISPTCAGCRELDIGPFSDKQIIEAGAAFVTIRINVVEDPATAVAYRAAVIPDVRFLGPDGSEIGRLRQRKPGSRWDTVAVLAQMREVATRYARP